jgi:hypothetical protein
MALKYGRKVKWMISHDISYTLESNPHSVFGDLLTLSDLAEYIYSATSHATSRDGVVVLRDFHNIIKKKVLKILDSGLYH